MPHRKRGSAASEVPAVKRDEIAHLSKKAEATPGRRGLFLRGGALPLPRKPLPRPPNPLSGFAPDR